MNLLSLIVLLPFASALAVLLLPPSRAVAAARLGTGVAVAGALWLAVQFDAAAGFQFAWSQPWLPELGIGFALALDGLSLPLFVMAAVVAFAATWCGWEVKSRDRSFWFLFLLLCGGGLGAFASADLFLYYFFLEFEVLVAFALIGIWGRGAATAAAMRMTLMVAAASLAVLVGVTVLGVEARHFGLAEVADHLAAHPLSPLLQGRLFLLFLLGFGLLFALVPLHSWSPSAYAVAPTAVAMVCAGVFKNAAAYGLLRVGLTLLPEGARAWAPAMAGLAAVNILYAGWIALRQQEWKLLLGYASVSHAGYVLLGLACSNAAGLSGALFSMTAHGLATALAFALAGAVEFRTGHRSTQGPGGLARAMPFTGVCAVVAALALCGQPGSGNFVGEVLVFIGSWQQGGTARIAALCAVWGIVITAAYLLPAVRQTFFGPRPDSLAGVKELDWAGRLPLLLLIAALLALGVYPRLLTDRSGPAVERVARGLEASSPPSGDRIAQVRTGHPSTFTLHTSKSDSGFRFQVSGFVPPAAEAGAAR